MTTSKPSILFISHDANRAGAQLFLVNMMKEMKERGYFVGLLLLQPWGGLKEDFLQAANLTFEMPSEVPKLKRVLGKNLEKHQRKFVREIRKIHVFDLIYANTIATAYWALQIKKMTQWPLVTHIHELKHSLELYSKKEEREELLLQSDSIIACSNAVADNLRTYGQVHPEKVITIHSFVDNDLMLKVHSSSDSSLVKREFGIPENKILIGACGNSEWRKGVDLFVDLATKAQSEPNHSLFFIWIGARNDGDPYTSEIEARISQTSLKNILLIPQTSKAKELINALDIFVVSSREDPFPLVMLEAALCQKPILGFENTGGCTEFVKDNCGWLAPFEDSEALYQLLLKMSASAELRENFGKKGQQEVLEKYNFRESFQKIEQHLLSLSAV